MSKSHFLNRVEELEALERRWQEGEAQLFTIWGRRRVGKSLLLTEFCRGKRSLFFEATSGTARDQLADFGSRLAAATARAQLEVPDWRAGLDAVADWAAEGPVMVVLDEFPFLARQTPDIGSILNVFWRERGSRLPIFIVLSGSEIGFFEREVVGYSATTYGRRSGQLRLRPFRPADVSLFLPGWTAEERIRAYAVFGGMPYYLDHVRPDVDLAGNILNLILAPDGLLHEEARLLLQQELNDADSHFSVLRAIAAGQTRISQIAARTGIDSARVSQLLTHLRQLWLIEREVLVTERNPERTRKARYRILDPYLRFWFRFVLPFESRLVDFKGAERHLADQVMPALDEFVSSPGFEEVCRQWLLESSEAAAVGRWWGRVRERTESGLRDVEREIDVVAVDGDGEVTAAGSCKWTGRAVTVADLRELEILASHIAPARAVDLYLFSRGGFDEELLALGGTRSDVHLVLPQELVGARS